MTEGLAGGPALSRRGLFGAGVRSALEARLEAPAPAPRGPTRLPVAPDTGRLAPIAAAMAEIAAVEEGQSVLTACEAEGPLASAVARRGAAVAVGEALPLAWPDESFDAVLAFFGAADHPRPRELAGELTRVARPAAPIVIAAWATQPWGRYETAYRHFFGFPDFDVHSFRLPELAREYALVFARMP